MKKIALLILVGLTGAMVARAQFGGYGVKAGLGMATISDDLGAKSPVLAANIGGYINYTFQQSESVFAEVFYLQTGLNLVRRGGNFEEVMERGATLSIRTGYYHSYYLQLPILAGLHYELPIREAGHVVGLYLGPVVSFGVFGGYGDRKITPGIASPSANYDVNFNGTDADRKLFNHINRLDIGATIGLTYERQRLTLSLFIDRGFLATSDGDDILRIIQNRQQQSSDVDVKIPDGHNIAYMLSISYQLGDLSK